MSEAQTPNSTLTQEQIVRKVTLFDYALHIASPFTFMILSIIALAINYIKRPDAVGTVYESHMNYMIRTCWWTVGWTIVAYMFAILFGLITFTLGFVFLPAIVVLPVIWYVYRMVRGVLRAIDNRPMD